MIILHSGSELPSDTSPSRVPLFDLMHTNAWRRSDGAHLGGKLHYTHTNQQLTEALNYGAVTAERAYVVAATAGRDLTLISDLARSCRWWRQHHEHSNTTAIMTSPLANATLVISALRTQMRAHPADYYIIVSATIDPFADAELFRQARLAWQYGSAPVVVAFEGAEPNIATAVADARTLHGPDVRIVILRADLAGAPAKTVEAAAAYKHPMLPVQPLWSASALAVLISQNVMQAAHRFDEHGDDGIDAALWADHDHGYAHSHGDEEHSHSHSHADQHSHSHSHADQHSHDNGNSHNHSDGHHHSHDHTHTESHAHPHTTQHSH